MQAQQLTVKRFKPRHVSSGQILITEDFPPGRSSYCPKSFSQILGLILRIEGTFGVKPLPLPSSGLSVPYFTILKKKKMFSPCKLIPGMMLLPMQTFSAFHSLGLCKKTSPPNSTSLSGTQVKTYLQSTAFIVLPSRFGN